MSDWLRVNKSRRCLICERADWCLIARDRSAAICPRVQSDTRAGDAGWLHKLTDAHHHRRRVRAVRTAPEPPGRADLGGLEKMSQQGEKYRQNKRGVESRFSCGFQSPNLK